MIAGGLEDDTIEIVKSTTVTLFRQIIHLVSQDLFVSTIERMARLMRTGKFTGRTVIHWNQGGVKKIETEEETKNN